MTSYWSINNSVARQQVQPGVRLSEPTVDMEAKAERLQGNFQKSAVPKAPKTRGLIVKIFACVLGTVLVILISIFVVHFWDGWFPSESVTLGGVVDPAVTPNLDSMHQDGASSTHMQVYQERFSGFVKVLATHKYFVLFTTISILFLIAAITASVVVYKQRQDEQREALEAAARLEAERNVAIVKLKTQLEREQPSSPEITGLKLVGCIFAAFIGLVLIVILIIMVIIQCRPRSIKPVGGLIKRGSHTGPVRNPHTGRWEQYNRTEVLNPDLVQNPPGFKVLDNPEEGRPPSSSGSEETPGDPLQVLPPTSTE